MKPQEWPFATEIIVSAVQSHSVVEAEDLKSVAFAACPSAWDLTAAANVAAAHSGIESVTSFAVVSVVSVSVELGSGAN